MTNSPRADILGGGIPFGLLCLANVEAGNLLAVIAFGSLFLGTVIVCVSATAAAWVSANRAVYIGFVALIALGGLLDWILW
ncbi:hypothetical protein [Natronolimnobius baerhuensis]|uniref:Uncharacterized protein n=1 Tax=Natronolimnobius baerhuensis TaxID=253108 RepID=A0A202E7E2_9EURY|nr:hypothetical protein [Natronolimnobius baerhuensis]OVE84196.1 hypothetical protein B2G88_07175 [Natronolimnobius baerhuensis]